MEKCIVWTVFGFTRRMSNAFRELERAGVSVFDRLRLNHVQSMAFQPAHSMHVQRLTDALGVIPDPSPHSSIR